jgi:hypothetical protein
MAGITKLNPTSTTLNFESVGKNIDFFTVDYINAINGSAGPSGAQQAVLNAIQQYGTIIAAGPLVNSNTEQTFAVEGEGAVVVATLQAAIRALGTVDSVNLGSSTVTATKLGILTAAAVS